jgi:hypothetical protein
MVTADDCSRSFRGTTAFLSRRAEGLAAFELTEAGFWKSFWALGLTLPAYIVAVALERNRLGLADGILFGDAGLAVRVAIAHIGGFLAMPVVMIFVARSFGLGRGYVPFVIVTNWIGVFGMLVLAMPGLLFLTGFETASLTGLFTLGFLAIFLHLNWFATRITLEVGPFAAALVTALGFVLDLGIGTLVGAIAA